MFRVQYARRHHVRIGFKGLKDESFDINDNSIEDGPQVDINLTQDKSKEDNKNDNSSAQLAFAASDEEEK